MEHLTDRLGVQLTFEGAAHLAARPEFAASQKLAQLLMAAQNTALVYRLLASVNPGEGTRTLIGSADMGAHWSGCALVISAFGPGGRTGRLAVLGPMRMNYNRSIAAARTAARLLDETWPSEE